MTQQQSEFAVMITKLAERFVNLTLGQLDDGIAEALALLGQYTDAHRCSIFQFSLPHTHISTTYEWCAPGIQPQRAAAQHLPVTAFPWIMSQHARGEVLHIPDVAMLPPAAASEKRAFQQDGVKSLIVVPLVLGGKAFGFLLLSSRHAQLRWSPELFALLRLTGEILANALDRSATVALLHEQDERYRILVETSPDGIIIYKNNRITFVNSAGLRLVGATLAAELLGKSPLDLIHPADQVNLMQLHQQVLSAVHVLPHYTAKLIRMDGRVLDMEMGAASFVDHGERVILLIVRDITERKRLEEQLLQAAKMEAIGRLAGGIAHDFNNLLTAIMGYNALSMEELLPEDPHYEYASEMNKAIERAVTLTRQLLVFSRRQDLKPQPFDVNVVIRHLMGVLRPLLGETIHIHTELDKSAGLVMVGSGQLDQVIINLAVNARDAMPLGGQLTIATQMLEAGAKVRLTVTDTGMGMDETTRARIFEPFFTTKPQNQGTGLGLANVYSIVTQHGGEIQVRSAPSQGTTFTIDWPRLEALERVPRQAEPAQLKTPQNQATILVIEDDELVLTFIQTTLTKYGYQVFTASTGTSALAFQQRYRHRIDLIVTDLLLSDLNGQALVERIRQERPGNKALFLTGYPDEILRQYEIDLRGAPLLRKPFSGHDLLRSAQMVLVSGATEPVKQFQ